MIAALVLGTGLPTSATYIITSIMAAPALVQLGIPRLVAHMSSSISASLPTSRRRRPSRRTRPRPSPAAPGSSATSRRRPGDEAAGANQVAERAGKDQQDAAGEQWERTLLIGAGPLGIAYRTATATLGIVIRSSAGS